MSSDDNHSRRDAETNLALGAFILILGLVVMSGTVVAETTRAMTVNAIAAGILIVIGIGFLVVGGRAFGRLK